MSSLEWIERKENATPKACYRQCALIGTDSRIERCGPTMTMSPAAYLQRLTTSVLEQNTRL